jgi:hypothetical protein
MPTQALQSSAELNRTIAANTAEDCVDVSAHNTMEDVSWVDEWSVQAKQCVLGLDGCI